MASPHTAGIVALLLQAYPTASVAEISRRLAEASQKVQQEGGKLRGKCACEGCMCGVHPVTHLPLLPCPPFTLPPQITFETKTAPRFLQVGGRAVGTRTERSL